MLILHPILPSIGTLHAVLPLHPIIALNILYIICFRQKKTRYFREKSNKIL
jgi:uncharacterized membrane protein YbaN (DUF454 family)